MPQNTKANTLHILAGNIQADTLHIAFLHSSHNTNLEADTLPVVPAVLVAVVVAAVRATTDAVLRAAIRSYLIANEAKHVAVGVEGRSCSKAEVGSRHLGGRGSTLEVEGIGSIEKDRVEEDTEDDLEVEQLTQVAIVKVRVAIVRAVRAARPAGCRAEEC